MQTAPMAASDDVTLLMEDVQGNGGTATLVLVGAGSPAHITTHSSTSTSKASRSPLPGWKPPCVHHP
jgi:hypothetical protein